MPRPTKQKHTTTTLDSALRVRWKDSEVSSLIDLIYEHGHKFSTDSQSASYKSAFWTFLATKLVDDNDEPLKNADQIKNKYKQVSSICFDVLKWCLILDTILKQLKKAYAVCRRLQSLSGFGWSPYTGCDIENLNKKAWEDWVAISVRFHYSFFASSVLKLLLSQSNAPARAYKTKPFPNWDRMVELVEGSAATGIDSFNPTRGLPEHQSSFGDLDGHHSAHSDGSNSPLGSDIDVDDDSNPDTDHDAPTASHQVSFMFDYIEFSFLKP